MPEERHFVRTRKGRLVAGVCSGLGAQLRVDPLLLRIAFVGLAFLGGAGFWLYLAIFLLTPEEGATRAPIRLRRSAWPRVAGFLAFAAAIGIALSSVHWVTNAAPGLIAAFALFALVAVAARYARRRLRAAVARSESRSADLRLASNIASVAAVAADISLFALAGAWLAGIDGRAAAWAVVAAGAVLIVAAFAGARALVAPALAFAVAVALFAAASVDLHGGFGERVYRPQSLGALRGSYRLGAGRLEVDLRDLSFPTGETRMHIRLGVGEAVVVVPDEVCVATRASVGGGYVGALDHDSRGLDVSFSQHPTPPHGSRLLLLEGNVGLGALFVVDRPLAGNFQPGLYGTNSACRGVAG